MKKLLIVILIGSLYSCITPQQHARNLVRKGWEKVQEGMALDPKLADSIKKAITITITIPASRDSSHITPILDSVKHSLDLLSYDKLVIANDSILKLLQSTKSPLERELDLAELSKENKALKYYRDKFLRGYAKDSTYVIQLDSITKASFIIINGQLNDFKIHRAKTQVKEKVQTLTVSLDGRKIINAQPFYKDTWFIVSLILLLIIVLFIVIMIKTRR